MRVTRLTKNGEDRQREKWKEVAAFKSLVWVVRNRVGRNNTYRVKKLRERQLKSRRERGLEDSR